MYCTHTTEGQGQASRAAAQGSHDAIRNYLPFSFTSSGYMATFCCVKFMAVHDGFKQLQEHNQISNLVGKSPLFP